jgi:hypothetical protein
VLTTCWSLKGGVGTSVVAATLALRTAASGVECLLVDLGGDQPAVLGAAPPAGPGVGDWLAAGADVPVDALSQLEAPVVERLSLLPLGETTAPPSIDRLAVLAAVLSATSRACVVDAGPTAAIGRWWAGSGLSLLVVRPCYLALRRVGAVDAGTEIVLVEEPGRALSAADVGAATGARIRCLLPWDPAVARAVDAGLLATRLPRSTRPLGTAA